MFLKCSHMGCWNPAYRKSGLCSRHGIDASSGGLPADTGNVRKGAPCPTGEAGALNLPTGGDA